MAVYHPVNVTCTCGSSFRANLARSVNAGRTPAVREQILRGEFHRVICSTCGRRNAAEPPFFYTDLSRNAVYFVRPRGERFTHRDHSKRLDLAAADVPADLASSDVRQLRVLYGLDELREKLVAQNAGIDDRVVELLKIFLLQEHPFLLQKPRLLMHLLDVHAAAFDFVAYHQHHSDYFKMSLPRAQADDVLAREPELRTWVRKQHKNEDLFSLSDHWVNFRRWTTRYSALDALRALTKQIEDGNKPKLNTASFRTMTQRLPRGTELPAWAKRDLRTVFDYAKAGKFEKAEDALFEVRFGFALDDEWSRNSKPNDIDTIWQLLRSLPLSNIEGNTKIDAIKLDQGEGGGTYGNDVIAIGEQELGHRERFEDVLRHEVGHAVHEQRDSIVTPWLQSRFGWLHIPSSDAGVDRWVKLMGGWGPLSPQQRKEVTQFLRQAAGPGGQWNSGPQPNPPAAHPWWSKNFGPRLAFEQSGREDWFVNFQNWYRVGDKAFALNYWYSAFMVVDAATLDLIAKMPDNYAAMSYWEFFAETYALYYDYDDQERSVIPKDVAKWLNENIGKPDPKNPRRPETKRKPATKRA